MRLKWFIVGVITGIVALASLQFAMYLLQRNDERDYFESHRSFAEAFGQWMSREAPRHGEQFAGMMGGWHRINRWYPITKEQLVLIAGNPTEMKPHPDGKFEYIYDYEDQLKDSFIS